MASKKTNVDACLFTKINKDEKTFVVIWVDDIIITTTSDEEMNRTKNSLKEKFKMKDLGQVSWFLGMEFEVTNDGIYLSQQRYIRNILERFGMADSNPRETPCEIKIDEYEKKIINSKEDIKTYRKIVGSLIYAMTCSRPDLSYVVTKLSQSLENPSEGDWMTIKQVLRYLKGTQNQKLFYGKTQNNLEISGYCDSDWASSKDRRSTTGYCFSLNEGSGSISWKSKKQETIALSSCEAYGRHTRSYVFVNVNKRFWNT